ncbi:MAG: M23 family metallopeptidase [Candidatus Neomarinimicrobiota bacterium]
MIKNICNITIVMSLWIACQSQAQPPSATALSITPVIPVEKEICTRFYAPFADSDRQQYAVIKNRIISRYGDYRSSAIKGHRHAGIDLRGECGEPVYAIGIGTVVDIFRGFPNRTVVVKHYLSAGDSVYSEYTHIEDVRVKSGERVDQNTCLGRIFNAEELQRSNFNTFSHLHLEFRKSLADSGKASWQSLTMAELNKYCLDPTVLLPKYLK